MCVLIMLGRNFIRESLEAILKNLREVNRANMVKYRKVPKFWDARNLCCNLPKIQTKMPNHKGYFVTMVQMEKQTVKTLIRSSLIWVCTVCPNLSVRKLRVITLFFSGYRCCDKFSFVGCWFSYGITQHSSNNSSGKSHF